MRAVSLAPLRPASGDVLVPSVIASDGSSIVITGSGRGSSGSAIVSPIMISSMPAMAITSPGPTRSAETRSRPSATNSSVILMRRDCAVGLAPGHLLALAQLALVHAAEREPAQVRRRVEVGDARLEGAPSW